MIRYDYGAVARTFKLNTSVLNQSREAAAVGMDTLGVHMQLALGLGDNATEAWREYVKDTYVSMQAVANRSVTLAPLYTMAQLSAYLQRCFMLDAALAEAKRDLLMTQWTDTYTENAMADFFGPNWQAVVSAAAATGTQQWFRWNTIANRTAAELPHPHCALFDNYEYLLGNVFKDDNTGRWMYLYFHNFNKSLTTATPSFTQALDAAETLLMFSGVVPTYLTDQVVSYIRADMLNAFGHKLDRDYGVVIDFHTAPRPIYDGQLVAALNNWRPIPRAVAALNSQASSIELAAQANHSATGWLTDIDLAASFGGTITFVQDPYSFTASNLGPHASTALQAARNNFNDIPVRISGNVFDGAGGLDQTLFVEKLDSQVTSNVQDYSFLTVVFTPYSELGFTLGQMWCICRSAANATIYTAFLCPAIMYNAAPAYAPLMPDPAVKAMATFSLCDVGNVLLYEYQGTTGAMSVTDLTKTIDATEIIAEPVQEWAEVSGPTLRTYAGYAAKALFDIGITLSRSVNTRERITRDNASKVVDRNSGDRGRSNRGGRHNARSRKKVSASEYLAQMAGAGRG